MARTVSEVQETTTRTGNTLNKTTRIKDDRPTSQYAGNWLENLVWTVAVIILVLLAFRFVLSLFGANSSNGFANFIYTTSHPFVTPFFGLFNYHEYAYGVSRFEGYTLVAMAVYLVLAWIITRLINLATPPA